MLEYKDDGPILALGTAMVVNGDRCCILLVEAGGSAPGDLLSALSRRGLTLVVATDPPAVMVGLARRPTVALIVVDPRRYSRIGELVDAVGRYYPRTVCWRFGSEDGVAPPSLTRLHREEAAVVEPGKQANPRHQTETAARRSRSARLQSILVQVPPEADAGGLLITEEELSMLLGPQPGSQVGCSEG